MKYVIGVVAAAVVIGGIWYTTSDKAVAPVVSPAGSAARSVTPTAVSATATPKASSGPTAYTAAQVATHSSRSSCWSIINGSVYDLTSYIPKHPGGPQRILPICGKDGTSTFEGQHNGQSKPENMLATLKIGVLSP